jgi:hypothetical protein
MACPRTAPLREGRGYRSEHADGVPPHCPPCGRVAGTGRSTPMACPGTISQLAGGSRSRVPVGACRWRAPALPPLRGGSGGRRAEEHCPPAGGGFRGSARRRALKHHVRTAIRCRVSLEPADRWRSGLGPLAARRVDRRQMSRRLVVPSGIHPHECPSHRRTVKCGPIRGDLWFLSDCFVIARSSPHSRLRTSSLWFQPPGR